MLEEEDEIFVCLFVSVSLFALFSFLYHLEREKGERKTGETNHRREKGRVKEEIENRERRILSSILLSLTVSESEADLSTKSVAAKESFTVPVTALEP